MSNQGNSQNVTPRPRVEALEVRIDHVWLEETLRREDRGITPGFAFGRSLAEGRA